MKSYLTPEEIARMESEASNLRDRLLIHLLFHLGCCISEALALTVDNIDFDNATICILHLKTRIKLTCSNCRSRLGRTQTFCPGCGEKISEVLTQQQGSRHQRVLPIDTETLKMLREYIDRGGPVIQNGKRLIFAIGRHRGWQIIKQCAKKARLPNMTNPETGKAHNVSPHRLRDAFAVHAMKLDDSGDGMRLLQQHLGYQSSNTTARCGKVASKKHRKWYDKLWSEDKP